MWVLTGSVAYSSSIVSGMQGPSNEQIFQEFSGDGQNLHYVWDHGPSSFHELVFADPECGCLMNLFEQEFISAMSCLHSWYAFKILPAKTVWWQGCWGTQSACGGRWIVSLQRWKHCDRGCCNGHWTEHLSTKSSRVNRANNCSVWTEQLLFEQSQQFQKYWVGILTGMTMALGFW